MKDNQGFSYQIYETYFRQAKDAYAAGRMDEARKMYFHSAEALLRSAKETDGEMKEALVRRAQKLMRLAESIPETPAPKPRRTEGTSAASSGQGRRANISKEKSGEDEEGVKVWQSTESPGVSFDDIAGLADVKESIQMRLILPRKYPEVYARFRYEAKGGILLYGPPGTGKTMIAKAIATEIQAAFYPVFCSDIVGKYFGEAEKNIRSLFETARQHERAIIFFDEFEALAAKRGGHSTVMNRLVPELLGQMDGFRNDEEKDLLIVAATNRPWDLDSAFLRPPRLTQKIYVGLPDYEARLFLAKKAFASVPCEEEKLAERIAEVSEGCNAADINALCGRIKENAVRYAIANHQENGAVRREDLDDALENFHSSVQKSDLDAIRRWEQSQQH
ncbi:MAG: ATP-binding protein [Eubacteriales bacterium]|nr:ATP-binding protein [Eubacteriales bacterium]